MVHLADFLGAAATSHPHLASALAALPPLPPTAAHRCLLCGPERSGKTSLLFALALSLARQGQRVLLLCRRSAHRCMHRRRSRSLRAHQPSGAARQLPTARQQARTAPLEASAAGFPVSPPLLFVAAAAAAPRARAPRILFLNLLSPSIHP